jgi:hypothetical protein
MRLGRIPCQSHPVRRASSPSLLNESLFRLATSENGPFAFPFAATRSVTPSATQGYLKQTTSVLIARPPSHDKSPVRPGEKNGPKYAGNPPCGGWHRAFEPGRRLLTPYTLLWAGLAAQAVLDPGRLGVLRLYPGLPVIPGDLVYMLGPESPYRIRRSPRRRPDVFSYRIVHPTTLLMRSR